MNGAPGEGATITARSMLVDDNKDFDQVFILFQSAMLGFVGASFKDPAGIVCEYLGEPSGLTHRELSAIHANTNNRMKPPEASSSSSVGSLT